MRYDAFRDAGGEQSASFALLDNHRSGVVFSAIAARDFARIYVKHLRDGVADRDLSPEEQQAVAAAVPRPLAAGEDGPRARAGSADARRAGAAAVTRRRAHASPGRRARASRAPPHRSAGAWTTAARPTPARPDPPPAAGAAGRTAGVRLRPPPDDRSALPRTPRRLIA